MRFILILLCISITYAQPHFQRIQLDSLVSIELPGTPTMRDTLGIRFFEHIEDEISYSAMKLTGRKMSIRHPSELSFRYREFIEGMLVRYPNPIIKTDTVITMNQLRTKLVTADLTIDSTAYQLMITAQYIRGHLYVYQLFYPSARRDDLPRDAGAFIASLNTPGLTVVDQVFNAGSDSLSGLGLMVDIILVILVGLTGFVIARLVLTIRQGSSA